MRIHYKWQPRATRVSVGAVKEIFRKLDDRPRAVRLSITPNDWMLSFKNHSGSVLVGRYTAATSIEELHDDIEFVAREMAKGVARAA